MKLKGELIYKIIGIGLFIYMLVLLGRTSYLNLKINKQVNDLKASVEELAEENRQIATDIEYFKTDQYREKVARQRLGLKKQDEEVLVVVPEKESEKKKVEKKTPNYLKWFKFVKGETF